MLSRKEVIADMGYDPIFMIIEIKLKNGKCITISVPKGTVFSSTQLAVLVSRALNGSLSDGLVVE